MSERIIHIYILSDPRTGIARYVGKTVNPKARLKSHIREPRRSHKNYWVKSLLRAGFEPVMEIIEEVTEAQWEEAERFYCAFFRSVGGALLNQDIGGLSAKGMSASAKATLKKASTGRRHTPETIEKMREIKLRAVTPELRERMGALWRGKKMPDELVRKRAATQIGAKRSNEFKQGQRLRGLGKKHTPDSKEKNRVAHLGKNASAETRALLSEVKLGKKRGPYKPGTGENISRALTGKKHTAESRRNMGLSRLGKKRGPYKTSGKKRGPMSLESRQKMKDAWARRKALTTAP